MRAANWLAEEIAMFGGGYGVLALPQETISLRPQRELQHGTMHSTPSPLLSHPPLAPRPAGHRGSVPALSPLLLSPFRSATFEAGRGG